MPGLINSTSLADGVGLTWLDGGLGGNGLSVSNVPAVYMNATGVNLYTNSLQGTPSGLFAMSAWYNSHYDGAINRTKWTIYQANSTNGGRPGGGTVWSEANAGTGNNGRIRIYFRDNTGPPGNGSGRLYVGDDPTSLNTWNHILVSADTTGETYNVHFYVNDVELDTFISFTDGTLPFVQDTYRNTFYVQDWELPQPDTQPAIQDMYNVWIAGDQFIDFSIEANRRKFITADGRPVPLGDNGELPTGTSPTIYLTGGAADFITNRGTGGPFVLNGPLVNASSAPTIAGQP